MRRVKVFEIERKTDGFDDYCHDLKCRLACCSTNWYSLCDEDYELLLSQCGEEYLLVEEPRQPEVIWDLIDQAREGDDKTKSGKKARLLARKAKIEKELEKL